MMMMMTTEMHGSAIENLSSPDKVHPVANNENKIILTNLTKNNTVIHTSRCDNKQYIMHRRPQDSHIHIYLESLCIRRFPTHNTSR